MLLVSFSASARASQPHYSHVHAAPLPIPVASSNCGHRLMQLTLGCCCSLLAVAVVFRDLLHTTGLAADRRDSRWAAGRTEQDEVHVMLAIVGTANVQASGRRAI